MSDILFYDKKTCGTCQKAKLWLAVRKIPVTVIDIEKQPPDRSLLSRLIDERGVRACLNSRSTLYKTHNLSQTELSKDQALALMAKDPNLIKRPVILLPTGQSLQGFDSDAFEAVFG
jgi:Spx/MgsR family transcriptional regulator